MYKFSFKKYVNDLYNGLITQSLECIINDNYMKKYDNTYIDEVLLSKMKCPSKNRIKEDRIYINDMGKEVVYTLLHPHLSIKIIFKKEWLIKVA